MEYNHKEIEKRWQQYWKDNNVYKPTSTQSVRSSTFSTCFLILRVRDFT